MWTESTREFLAPKHNYLEVQSLSRRSRKYFDVEQVYLMRTSKNVSILLYRQKNPAGARRYIASVFHVEPPSWL